MVLQDAENKLWKYYGNCGIIIVDNQNGGTSKELRYATKGTGKLLLADDEEEEFRAGDVVRFADKDVHGLLNAGDTEFVYVSVTAPPIHFGYAYKEKK